MEQTALKFTTPEDFNQLKLLKQAPGGYFKN